MTDTQINAALARSAMWILDEIQDWYKDPAHQAEYEAWLKEQGNK